MIFIHFFDHFFFRFGWLQHNIGPNIISIGQFTLPKWKKKLEKNIQ